MATKYNEIRLTCRAAAEPRAIGGNDVKGYSVFVGFDTGNYKNPSGFTSVTHWDPASPLTDTVKGDEITVAGSLSFDEWGGPRGSADHKTAIKITADSIEV